MPSTSKKQSNFMAAVANNPKFAKKAGVPQSVGQDFAEADKVKTPKSRSDLQGINKQKTDHGSMSLFNKGGAMKDIKQDKAMVKKAVGMHDKQMHGGKKTDMGALKKGGMAMVMKDGKKVPAFAAKSGGMTKMADGGMTDPRAKMMMAKMGRAMPKRPAEAPMMNKGGMTKMAKGGGIESKGKTKGTMIRMKSGGKAC